MEITISLYGDAAFLNTLSVFVGILGTGIVVKVITVVWRMIPFLG